jgi:hypothetical protein
MRGPSEIHTQRGNAPARDIVADHVANFLRAMWLFQQVLGHRSGRYLGHSILETNISSR